MEFPVFKDFTMDVFNVYRIVIKNIRRKKERNVEINVDLLSLSLMIIVANGCYQKAGKHDFVRGYKSIPAAKALIWSIHTAAGNLRIVCRDQELIIGGNTIVFNNKQKKLLKIV